MDKLFEVEKNRKEWLADDREKIIRQLDDIQNLLEIETQQKESCLKRCD